MELPLLIAAILLAGLACPAMMWWQRRRGHVASCCAPASGGRESHEIDALRGRQRELAARIEAVESGVDGVDERAPAPGGFD